MSTEHEPVAHSAEEAAKLDTAALVERVRHGMDQTWPDALAALDSLTAALKERDDEIVLLKAMDMTATSAQWEGEAKRLRAALKRAERRVGSLEGEIDVCLQAGKLLSNQRDAAEARAQKAEEGRGRDQAECVRLHNALVKAEALVDQMRRRAEAAEAHVREAEAVVEVVRRAKHELNQWAFSNGTAMYRVERAEEILDRALAALDEPPTGGKRWLM